MPYVNPEPGHSLSCLIHVLVSGLSIFTTLRSLYEAVTPVAYQDVLKAGIGQFRAFESPRVLTRTNSWGHFVVHGLACESSKA